MSSKITKKGNKKSSKKSTRKSRLFGKQLDDFDELEPGKTYILMGQGNVVSFLADDNIMDQNQKYEYHPVIYCGTDRRREKYIFKNFNNQEIYEIYDESDLRDGKSLILFEQKLLPEIDSRISSFVSGGKYKKSIKQRKRISKKLKQKI